MLFLILTETDSKKFESYIFFNILFTSFSVISSLIDTPENIFIVSGEIRLLPSTTIFSIISDFEIELTPKKNKINTQFILNIDFPLWCKFYTPTDIVGYWKPDKFEEQIQIGDTIINNNDYVMADIDGVVIIPQSDVEGVLIESEKLINTENQVRKAIREGMDPQKAYLKYGAF